MKKSERVYLVLFLHKGEHHLTVVAAVPVSSCVAIGRRLTRPHH
jgi:hypothetical protein